MFFCSGTPFWQPLAHCEGLCQSRMKKPTQVRPGSRCRWWARVQLQIKRRNKSRYQKGGGEKSGAAVASAEAELAAPNRSASRGPLDCEKHWPTKVLKTGKQEEGDWWRRTVRVRQSGGGKGYLLSFSFLTPQEVPAE